MLRRALLAVGVISYLSCVLYLSGIQKNDSSVNTLRKSEGGNVNIPDANNESLQKEVLPKNNTGAANQTKINNLGPTPVDLPSKDLGKVENKNHNGSNLRDRRTVEDEENVEEVSTSSDNENSEKLHIINADNHTKIIQYTEEKPNLTKVITFWQKLVSNNQETTTAKLSTDTTKTSPKAVKANITTNKVPIPAYKNNQTEDLKKPKTLVVNHTVDEETSSSDFEDMLSEYTSKETTQLPLSTTSATNEKPLQDDDADIFNDLLNTHDKDSPEMHNINEHMTKYSYEFKYAKVNYPLDNTPEEEQNRKSIQSDKQSQDTFAQDFNSLELNLLNNPTTLHSSVSAEDDYVKYVIDYNKADKKVGPNFTVLENDNNKITTSTQVPDAIIQLAENVKNLIIKDLDKHVTTTKTEVPTTTTDFTGNKNFIVIEKIMELLQKYKTESNIDVLSTTEMTKDISRTTRAVNRPKTKKTVPKKTKKKPNPGYPKKYENHKKIPVRTKLGNLRSQPTSLIKYLPPCVSANIANGFKPSPITIQTNLLEIPPLGVPVSNPASIVSHNIIISTIRPPYFQNLENYPHNYGRLINNHKPSKRIKMPQLGDLLENSNSKDEDCGNRKKTRVNKILAHRMREHDSVDNSDEEVNPLKKQKKIPTRYENVHGFHEKFENYQQSHGDTEDLFREDCSKDDTLPREPIKLLKRGNDAAFKKLLRSQQRVTDMLEQMLARSKNEDQIVVTT